MASVWGVPFNVDVWQFTFYNEDMLAEADVDPESLATWEGLEAAGAGLDQRWANTASVSSATWVRIPSW